MNVEMGTEAAQFPEMEYINEIFATHPSEPRLTLLCRASPYKVMFTMLSHAPSPNLVTPNLTLQR
jgi:hypothetical protein